ncbi:MAG: hypothetical protein DYG98_18795 [Haliscomenobacteraceae bacterium CHB4]|nr:hypothetical protein [Saprospiraceae bacterium]MCE7925106.1 hypothetical protein [Haliscomenobacteraceae bacterium CHB4]
MKSKTVLLPAFLLALAACGGEAPKPGIPPTEAPPVSSNVPQDARPITWLEGIYATSSSPAHEVYDLFDDDPATGWQTLAGTGPDEGIMLYFTNALPLQSVQLVPEEGSFQEESAFIQTYVNGSLGESGKPGDNIALGKKPVKSLYIRFVKTGQEQTAQREKEGAAIAIESFPANAYVGVKALNMLNDKGEPMRIMPPKRVFGSLSASSTLEPEMAYSAANLFDSRKEFVWVEGNKTSSGEGETLSFNFEEPVNITAIQIWNGYQRSDEHFAANARVRSFEFGAKDGTMAAYTLRDTKAGQKIELTTAVKGQRFELKVKSIYAGSKYKDLAVSDLVFFDGHRAFVLDSKLPEQNQAALRNKTGSSPLTQIFNRRISNSVEEAGVITQQSLILRSDGTFVFYSNDTMPDGTVSQTLADGNWEMVSSDAANFVIRIFGKWNNVSDFADYYRGRSSKKVTRIFSDELFTDGSVVRGKKMIGAFYIR